jgi:hypothetical protein
VRASFADSVIARIVPPEYASQDNGTPAKQPASMPRRWPALPTPPASSVSTRCGIMPGCWP